MQEKTKDIEVRWAKQLQKEHGKICYQQSVSLSTPVVSIVSGKNRLGYWTSNNKTISVSRYLIEKNPWEIVLEIFKHEMAHQYVSEYFDNSDRHGQGFKTACKTLGVHPVFVASGCNQEQIEVFRGTLPEKAQKMLRRVEKLLALGQSSNESEAQAASKKANYLLNKYNLDRIARDETDSPDIKYLYLRSNKKRMESIEKQILSFLEQYYFVNCIIATIYDVKTDEEYKAGVLIGNKEALVVAEYVYRFLLNTSKELWRDFRKKHSGQRTGKVAFDLGFMKGIISNHEMMFKEHDDAKINGDTSLPVALVKALRVKCQAENNFERNRLFPQTRRGGRTTFRMDKNAYFQGMEQGKRTHINRPVEHKKTGITALLNR
jgi:predicted SprT family Zn-dependent metalloprotease